MDQFGAGSVLTLCFPPRPGVCGEARGRPAALSDGRDRRAVCVLHRHGNVLLRPHRHDQEHLRGEAAQHRHSSFLQFFLFSHRGATVKNFDLVFEILARFFIFFIHYSHSIVM